MANLNFQYSSAPLRTVQEIQFGLLSPEEIKNMSVCKIEYPETMDEQKMRPREGGLNDPKLGSIDRSFKCETCDESMVECPGHFGHIELASPVFHVGFITKIKKVLETVCHNCGKILLDESSSIEFRDALRMRNAKRRFDSVWRACKPKIICEVAPPSDENEATASNEVKHDHGGCGNVQPTIKKEGLKLIGSWKPEKGDEEAGNLQPEKKTITPARALEIFRRISVEDLGKMGLSNDYARPEWMILTVLPVPPPPVRPSISVDGTGQGMRGEDDLTYKLGDIIRANGNVARCEQEGSPQHIVSQFQDLLQFHVATYMDNDIAGVPQALQKSGRPVKSIRARLKGKEGRLRGNLMGKRVDFSARTVITGDPNIGLDEVGVPRSIARTLTYPETVTPYNIHKLHQYVKNGPNEHPGAKYVIRDTGERIDLRHHKRAGEISLQYGWKVERHVVDGDFIIFNRQPSLHKESMMGHRVRVMPYSTFRMNLSATGPYNADFDGDEMNLHVPQSEETRSEVSQLCMVPKQIVSPQKNSPLMGIVQDTMCGIYKITRRDVFLNLDQVMNIMLWIPDWDGILPPPALLKPVQKWTGKQIISLALPTMLDLVIPSKGGLSPLDDSGIFVHSGDLMFGMFTKKEVGAAANGVIHVIFNELGPDAALKFFNATQRIVAYWLLHNGFSIGIGDTIPDRDTVKNIQKAIAEKKQVVQDLILKAEAGDLDQAPGQTVRGTFENKVSNALNTAREEAGNETQKRMKDLNNAVQMSRSGSKGSPINISQMMALVGQQAVEGNRIPFGFKYRTLPHFHKDDYSPEARGFVENSYLRGLTPAEFFFHAMSGREGLIDTAVKTAETGYIQRRLVKAMEDVQARYDGTVRNSLGDIVQFLYGEDGLDASNIEKQNLSILTCSNDKFNDLVHVDVMSDDSREFLACLEQEAAIVGDPKCQAMFEDEYQALSEAREFMRWWDWKREAEESVQLPLNIVRILEQTRANYKLKSTARSDLHPLEAIPMVRETLDRLTIVRGDDPLTQESRDNATRLFKAYLRSRLSFKRLVRDYRMTKLGLRHVLGELESKFLRAAVNPGEMVGVLAAQSVGEPATQMTLNTFHFAGVASKNITLGVPRLKEILNVATNIKTPNMKVYLETGTASTKDDAQRMRSLVEHTSLKSLTAMTEIYYDPDVTDTVLEADKDVVQAYWLLPDESGAPPEYHSKWVLRISLDRRRLLDKALAVSDVAGVVKEFFSGDLGIVFSDDNAEEPVIRIRLLTQSGKGVDEEDDSEKSDHELLKRLEVHILNRLTIRGVPAVKRAFLSSEPRVRIDEEGKMIYKKDDAECEEWYLDTTGSSLRSVISIRGVDAKRVYSNVFTEVFELLGVEACRAQLLRELAAVLGFDGAYINARHMGLLCDVMTARGWLVPVTRHGINKAETGALMRCSFEETVEILLDAAASGELDDCRGVSENIMLGQTAPLGTGDMDILLDQNMLDTVISDNSRLGIVPSMGLKGAEVDGAATPYGSSPLAEVGYLGSPDYGASFSPINNAGSETPSGFTEYTGTGFSSNMSPYNAKSPGAGFSPVSPFSSFGPTSPGMSPSSPMYSPSSPSMTSPAGFATSPGFSPASPAFTPASPVYSPTSPRQVSPTSPTYSPTSPSFSPTSPNYSPTSPSYSPTSPAFSPASPAYSPTSPAAPGTGRQFSPTSPVTYSPTSPAAYSPTSPALNYSPTSPQLGSPRSPVHLPAYSPASPIDSPGPPKGS